MMSSDAIKNNFEAKIKIIEEGNPNIGGIGFGITDVDGLNYCPFPPSRHFGSFVTYYTYKGKGEANFSEVSDAYVPREYR